MPGTRRLILKHVMSGICFKMNRTKQLPGDVSSFFSCQTYVATKDLKFYIQLHIDHGNTIKSLLEHVRYHHVR